MTAKKKKATTTKTVDSFENFAEQATASIQENFEKVTKNMSEVGDFSKDNIEAVVESASIYAKGVETISADQAAFAKEAMENTVEQIKSTAALKTPQEFFQAQTDFFRNAFETNVSQMQKFAEAWTETSRAAAEPISKRYTEVVEKAQAYSL